MKVVSPILAVVLLAGCANTPGWYAKHSLLFHHGPYETKWACLADAPGPPPVWLIALYVLVSIGAAWHHGATPQGGSDPPRECYEVSGGPQDQPPAQKQHDQGTHDGQGDVGDRDAGASEK